MASGTGSTIMRNGVSYKQKNDNNTRDEIEGMKVLTNDDVEKSQTPAEHGSTRITAMDVRLIRARG
jgi:hypothetical protein